MDYPDMKSLAKWQWSDQGVDEGLKRGWGWGACSMNGNETVFDRGPAEEAAGFKQEIMEGSALNLSALPAIVSTRNSRRSNTRRSAAATTRTMTRMVSVVALLWAVGTASCSRLDMGMDMDSELVETETGWQFGDDDNYDIEPFDNATAPAPAPAAKVKVSGNVIPLVNGDFELTNVTGNSTTLADATSTAIINWLPGGAGVQILMGASYKMPPLTPKSAYCIHLNNPASTANGTQGSLSTTLVANAATGKTYTVQYDTARMPDGPLNLWPALKVSAVEGGTVNAMVVKNPVYNSSDTAAKITWQKQSFVYTGTGAQTIIKFESMSEKYGPMIDNVQILSGKHELAAAPPARMAGGRCQRSLPLLSLLALALLHNYIL